MLHMGTSNGWATYWMHRQAQYLIAVSRKDLLTVAIEGIRDRILARMINRFTDTCVPHVVLALLSLVAVHPREFQRQALESSQKCTCPVRGCRQTPPRAEGGVLLCTAYWSLSTPQLQLEMEFGLRPVTLK